MNARSRWSDAQNAERLDVDNSFDRVVQFLEINTSVHKTVRALHMRHLFSPITAPALGVTETAWRPRWLRAREELDIVV